MCEFEATIVNKRYYNEDSSYGIYEFYTDDDIPVFKEYDFLGDTRKYSTLAGKMQELTVGCNYHIDAEIVSNKKYGDQYQPITVTSVIPKSKDIQILFLKSIINENTANNLLAKYPNIVEDVAKGKIEDIDYKDIKGVADKTWQKIKKKILENYAYSDLIAMLAPYGITFNMINKLVSYEDNMELLKQKIERNPYILVDIHGVGFSKCDSIALKLEPTLKSSQFRLIAFVKIFLTELGENEGHTWVTKKHLEEEITNNVPECLEHMIWLYTNDDFLVVQNDLVGLKKFYDVELEVYTRIKAKFHEDLKHELSDEQIEKAIKLAEEEQPFNYTDEQKDAIRATLKSNVSLITGNAGTGKSTILRAILKGFELNHMTVTSSALSAMAAQRIEEATDKKAATIHRTLDYDGNHFRIDDKNPFKFDVALMDEGSMTNAPLFLSWLRAIPEGTRIIICGDHKQLPPIGYGNIFSDLLENFDDSIVRRLTKPCRQDGESGILYDANKIRENINPIDYSELEQSKIVHGDKKDMCYMFKNDRERLFNIAFKTYMKSIEEEGVENVVIAVPRKQGCINSTFELNNAIDKALHDDSLFIQSGERKFHIGSKIVQMTNDYNNNVFNGQIGYISYISDDKHSCLIKFGNRDVEYEKEDLLNIDFAYALTCHKLQGSGYPTVIGIIDNTHYTLLDNCMLYTMITRAKKRCALLCEPQAFKTCIKKSHNSRNTWLSLQTRKIS